MQYLPALHKRHFIYADVLLSCSQPREQILSCDIPEVLANPILKAAR
jgi:hypothetical protein